jgi:3',5'-cyclic AMP phosphodiesterase CpdA
MKQMIKQWTSICAILCLTACTGQTPAEPFSFIVLDDVHYAGHDDYDWDIIDTFDETAATRVKATVERSEITFLPLMEELKSQAETFQPKPLAIVNSGDLIHGAVAIKPDAHCRNFIQKYTSVQMPIPLLNANGNHEMSDGMEEAYDQYFLPFLSEQLNQTLTARYYSVDIGNAHFIVLDGMPPDRTGGDHEERNWELQEKQWQWLEADLAENRDAEHIFMFSHAPLWPVSNGDVLYIFKPERRQAFLDLLLVNNVRALFAGHQHMNSVVVYEQAGKQLVQMIPNSSLPGLKTTKPAATRREYTADEVTPGTEREWDIRGRELVEREGNAIVHFEKTPQLSGYFMVSVDGPVITVRMYHGLGKQLYRTYTIRADEFTGFTRFE